VKARRYLARRPRRLGRIRRQVLGDPAQDARRGRTADGLGAGRCMSRVGLGPLGALAMLLRSLSFTYSAGKGTKPVQLS
jgi:hypothetical protein